MLDQTGEVSRVVRSSVRRGNVKSDPRLGIVGASSGGLYIGEKLPSAGGGVGWRGLAGVTLAYSR